LKGLNAFSGYDRGSGRASVWRFPVNFGLGISIPDGENDDVSIAIIDALRPQSWIVIG